MYKSIIHSYIEEHRNEIINTLKDLIKIPSVRSTAKDNAPFGKECNRVLEYTRNLYEENGFDTDLYSSDGYLLSYYGDYDSSIGIFAHADVVSCANDWNFTSPFEAIEKDGFVIGRGALDDKSAVVVSLYCAKMLKELNIPFNKKLVCFTGANEESGMADIKAYTKSHTPPEFAFVADTAFPPYIGNKGLLMFKAVCNTPLAPIKSFCGGQPGSVVGNAELSIEYDDKLYSKLCKYAGERLTVLRDDENIILKASGIPRHTALPEGSLNAGSIITKALLNSGFSDDGQIEFTAGILSDYYGGTLGIANDDPLFGKLTCVNYKIDTVEGKLVLDFNLRCGKEVDMKSLKSSIIKKFAENNWDVEIEREEKAHSISPDNPMLKKCMDSYRNFTGDSDAIWQINAGGTYARYLPCAIETGPTMIWREPDGTKAGHGGAHQPDECISIDGFFQALELTMLMLVECGK